MRVLVAAASHASSISGIQRHALNLTRCLTTMPQIEAVDLVLSPWQGEMLRQSGMQASPRLRVHLAPMHDGPIGRNLWYWRGLPRLAARLRPDIVQLTYPVPVNAAAFRCATVVSLHDLYPFEIPENFPQTKVFINRLVLKQCLHAVDAIACVSDTTLLRLRDYTPEPVWRKAARIFNCVEPQTTPVGASPVSGLEHEPFLLCVAQHRRNKNIPFLLRVFRNLLLNSTVSSSMKLLIVGIEGPDTKLICQTVADLGLSHRVVFLHGISDPALQWCYARCAAVVVPSLTEGFGLPVAEGLLAGCRVICSDLAVLREIGGGHCWFVSLSGDAECVFASTISQSLRHDRLNPIALPHLSVASLSSEYLSLYTSLLASRAAQGATPPEGTATGPRPLPTQPNPNLREVRRGRV